VVEEAVPAGARDVLVIISEGKEAVKEHFLPARALEERLALSGKTALLEQMQKINSLADISYVYQRELNGLGGAVKLAEDFAGGEPVLILLGDTVMDSAVSRPVAGQLVDVYEKFHSSVIALTPVAPEKISSYGIAGGRMADEDVLEVETLVEKPRPELAPGNLAVAARYLLTPEIFNALENTQPGVNKEIQLTDAIVRLMAKEKVYGCRIKGRRFDLGSVAGFIAANVEFALRRPELQETLGRQIWGILKEKNIEKQ
jgi:UTP--glucose-1-phosphate uridylyltransferase